MITISLCMIVRDEETVLSRCLNSFKDIVDEIIIVDTGSTDNTKAIAHRYTDNIYDFIWIDDFSAARNYAFSKASKDYIMWADADDVFPKKECEKLLKWKNDISYPETPDIVMLKYATAFNSNHIPSFLYYRERLICRKCGFKWKGRVHESITPSGKISYLDIYIEHRSNKKQYSKRNLQIYEKMKADGEIFCARDLFYYGRELYYHGQYFDALEIFSQFFKFSNAFVENQVEACRIAAYCCYPLNDRKKALDFLLKGLSYRVPSGELCCDLGKHFLDMQLYTQAIFWYRAAFNSPQNLENGGFILEECYGYLPCIQLSVCYDRLGQSNEAIRYHKLAGTYNPNGELFLQNEPYFKARELELS